jgi:hypothetical protein
MENFEPEIRRHEQIMLNKIARILWGALVAGIGVAFIVVIYASAAEASKMRGKPRYYPTPAGMTCADVKQKQREYGFTSVGQAKAYAAANGILVTPTQERQILSCLRGHG